MTKWVSFDGIGKRLLIFTTGKHGTMYQVFFGVFTHFSKFSRHAWEKIPKMLVFTRVYVCVKAKLTFVSFFLEFFFEPFP